ncbi:hypothetical protein BOTBODRAFT_171504 [Botryobasidium botryosum FD-172 SS1]|uniref:Uncharacterized protein n=1 Tax=Botryobasidium botryosum (strain FD-172 SS1) TaxID=930990 RepID=A0A067MSK6_BOTB1|nr:hypothetical protein BOTBODRAFT_171504 [Botryobasidium botryosum FD-172 SS1]
MHLSYAAILFGLASTALSKVSIVYPPARDQARPALKSACSPAISAYLKAHPGADLADIREAHGEEAIPAECALEWCGGYQASDNPKAVLKLLSSERTNITIDYTIPEKSSPEHDGDVFVPSLSIIRDGQRISMLDQYGSFDAGKAINGSQVLPYWSFDNMLKDQKLKYGDCAGPGECSISFQLFNFYHKAEKKGNQITSAVCIDLHVIWDSEMEASQRPLQ